MLKIAGGLPRPLNETFADSRPLMFLCMKPATQMQLADGTIAVVRSEIMRKLMAMVERVAREEAAVLIIGETGSGKELVAQAIHQHSLRCGKPFVDVNCAALPEHLVEANSSAMKRAHSAAPKRPSLVFLNSRTMAPCFSTKLANWTRKYRLSCCVCWMESLIIVLVAAEK